MKKTPKTASPEVLAALKRGKRVTAWLLKQEGGLVTARHFAKMSGWNTSEINDLRKSNKLIAVRQHGIWLYPAWQCADYYSGILRGLGTIVETLHNGGLDSIAMIGFFLSESDAIDNQRPLDALRLGHVDNVLKALSEWNVANICTLNAKKTINKPKINEKSVEDFHRIMKTHVDGIAKHRDAMRELIDEYSNIIDETSEGLDAIEGGLDTISQSL